MYKYITKMKTFLLDDDDVDLLGVGCETGPDAGEAGQGRAARLPDQEVGGVPGLGQVGEEGGGVEPEQVESCQTLLVPDQGSIDVVNTAEEMDPWVGHKQRDGRLGLGVPQHGAVNIVDDEIEIGGKAGEYLLNMLGCGGEVALNLQNILGDGG